MLPTLLQLDRTTREPALISATEQISWAELRDRVQQEAQRLHNVIGRRVGMLLSPSIDAITKLIAAVSLDCHVFLVAEDTPPASLEQWAADFGWTCAISADQHEAARVAYEQSSATAGEPGAVTILTSGTTGKSKAVEHSWDSLARPVRRTPNEPHPRWLLTFRPHLYAGLQVILQCLMNRGTLILPATGDSANEVASLASSSRVEFASATPSYWRWLMTLADPDLLTSIPLKQITLGGEAVDQATLDSLRTLFPNIRIVHIYATTELGRCFSVTDGQAGFPTKFLDCISPDGVEMRIEDGELIVKSSNAMRRYDQAADYQHDAWFSTGDLVSREGERVLFVGRKTDMINVGGNKVHPVEVERVIRQVPGVAEVRVYGKTSSLVGQLVACDLVVANGFEAAEVEQTVREKTRDELVSFQRPRLISIVDEVPLTSAGKTCRE